MPRGAQFRTRYHSYGKEHFSGNPQAFHHSRNTLGAIHHPHRYPRGLAQHLMPLLTVAMPFVICEIFKDAGQRSRAMKGAAIAGAVAEEAAWAIRNAKREGEAIKRAARSAEEHCL
jgi:hypothetical protein